MPRPLSPDVRMDVQVAYSRLTPKGYVPRPDRRLREEDLGPTYQRRRAMELLRDALETAIRRAMPVGHGPNYDLKPDGRAPGDLQKSVRVWVGRDGVAATAQTPYALYVLVSGVQPHPMGYFVGRVVRFYGSRDGQLVIRKVTAEQLARGRWHHKGQRPNNAFIAAWERDPGVLEARRKLEALGFTTRALMAE